MYKDINAVNSAMAVVRFNERNKNSSADFKTENKISQIVKTNSNQKPRYLYKYLKFNEHSFSSIQNSEIFFRKVSDLDDKSECIVTVDEPRLYDFQHNGLRRECVEQIFEIVRPYSDPGKFEEVKYEVYRIMDCNAVIRSHFLLDIADKFKEMAPGCNTAPIVNWLLSIPEKLDTPEIKTKFIELVKVCLNARTLLGVCSLSELCDNERMWEEYGDHGEGYCIEYDFDEYEKQKYLLEVNYQEQRDTNFIISFVATFVEDMIKQMSKGELANRDSKMLMLFATKYLEWSYQKEWRLLGDADTTEKGPKISKVYLGKNISKENKNKMKELCTSLCITVVEK